MAIYHARRSRAQGLPSLRLETVILVSSIFAGGAEVVLETVARRHEAGALHWRGYLSVGRRFLARCFRKYSFRPSQPRSGGPAGARSVTCGYRWHFVCAVEILSSRPCLLALEARLLQLHLFVGRRGPDQIGAVGVNIHGIPERDRRRVIENDSVRVLE